MLTAAAIVVDGSPAASAMAELQAGGDSAEVISLFVPKAKRRRGWGKALLAALEEALARRGCRLVYIDFRSDWPGVDPLERILAIRDWSPARTTKVLFKTSTEKFKQLGWPTRSSPPEGYEIFPWIDLEEAERREIISSNQKAPWFPQELSPFQRHDVLEASNSLGLRFGGRVVGWVVTHRTAPDTIHTTALFVHPEHGRKGISEALLAESIRRRVESGIPYGTFAVDASNKPVLEFVRRRLEPYLVYRADLRRAVKDLSASRDDFTRSDPADGAVATVL
jgi:ribosomal protein S18 acetylase RimI-like enzyme